MFVFSNTTTLYVHPAFFVHISLPSLPDYDVKLTYFTFYEGHEHKKMIFFLFS